MVFYFSGTGNSAYVAKRLAKHFDDQLVEMCQDTLKKKTCYEIAEDERIGFVCPVYWYNIPMMVEKFIRQLTLNGYNGQYIYAFVTYGGSSGNSIKQMEIELNRRGYKLSGKFGVLMPDNYVIAYNTSDEKTRHARVEKAKEKLQVIIPYIERREAAEITKKGVIALATPLLKQIYQHTNHTKKFYATNACINCRKCEKECPCNTIKIVDGKPTWLGNCSFCLKCISSCPVEAIQHGKKTVNRRRYYFKEDV